MKRAGIRKFMCAGCVLSVFLLVATGTPAPAQTPMTVADLETHLNRLTADLKGDGGRWEFKFQDVPMVLLADERYDRMRIVAFIEEGTDLDREKLLVLLQANFSRTLDARYAIFQNFLVAAFLHPLNPLTPAQLESALQQVSNLVRNYGGTFASGDLGFGTGQR